MKLIDFKLVTIICEPVLISSILKMTSDLGATGFTVTDVRGQGNGEKSSGEIPDSKSKIEIIAEPDLALVLIQALAEKFFENYSLITYVSDISILRPKKFEK
ncbi:MAG: transcriptional regulator [Moraxellaceae bacterium]|nr:transcriptional regulator [Pseudobdellovibrionaceae bacterium]